MSDKLDYSFMDNGILRVVWKNDMNREAVGAYIDLFARLMEEASEQSSLRILHDYRGVRTPPFNAMANGMKGLALRDDIFLRIAHLHNDSTLPRIVKNATIVARFNVNREFFENDEEQAIEWLLQDE